MRLASPARVQVIRLADAFRSEIRQARDLGCQLDVRTVETNPPTISGAGTAYARLMPTTDTARQGMQTAAAQDGAPGRDAIEARQFYERREDTLDALHVAIRKALEMANAALA